MAGRGVDEAGTGVVGDMVAIEQRNFEFVAAASGWAQVMRYPTLRVDIARRLNVDLRLGENFVRELRRRR
jgi:hypothetical protein